MLVPDDVRSLLQHDMIRHLSNFLRGKEITADRARGVHSIIGSRASRGKTVTPLKDKIRKKVFDVY